MKKLILSLFFLNLFLVAIADEGMWLPFMLEKYTIEQMRKKGFKLTAEDIYSINQVCLKDGIVGLTRGGFRYFCSGGIISDEGLLITNHHCGIGFVQEHSSVEKDYLANGFWAMRHEDELPAENLAISFLIRMEDVTSLVMSAVQDTMTGEERDQAIDAIIRKIEEDVVSGTHYKANIKSFFCGNQYYLSVYEVFPDVRLVGVPPQSIGRFGGDTDNWMWPRHTGDFCFFRIYAGKDNNPANYSIENVPYHPKKSLVISLKGVKEGDFSMVFGYPGTTNEYIPSFGIEMIQNFKNPANILCRETRLNIMAEKMQQNSQIRIQYTAKYSGIANGWKKSLGESRGLKRMDAISKKRQLEEDFQKWVKGDSLRVLKYGNIISEFKNVYTEYIPLNLALEYVNEAGYGIELIKFISNFNRLIQPSPTQSPEQIAKDMKKMVRTFYKDYNLSIDHLVCSKLLEIYDKGMDSNMKPDIFDIIHKKYKTNYTSFSNFLFSSTLFIDSCKVMALLDNPSPRALKRMQKDSGYKLFLSIYHFKNGPVFNHYNQLSIRIDTLQRLYMKGLMEMNSRQIFYPDANSTFRIAFGQVSGYNPQNAVHYNYLTTLDGIMQKENPDIDDFQVSPLLKDLYNKKDFGIYGSSNSMPVCFIASSHTSGGNSGSPVFNSEGQLVGVNFDRCWEGTMSDFMYDPMQCRNIVLDIRYVLFITDKFAKAGYLLKEMKIKY